MNLYLEKEPVTYYYHMIWIDRFFILSYFCGSSWTETTKTKITPPWQRKTIIYCGKKWLNNIQFSHKWLIMYDDEISFIFDVIQENQKKKEIKSNELKINWILSNDFYLIISMLNFIHFKFWKNFPIMFP